MDTNIFYVILAYINIPLGLATGGWFIFKSFQQTTDYAQRWNYIVIGIVNIYIGMCYVLLVFVYDVVIPMAITSILLRPANTLLLLIPFLIAYRRS